MSKLPGIKTRERFRVGNDDRSLDRYLKEIGETPLLTKEEEEALARKARHGNKTAKAKLVKANLRFVVSVAKTFQNQGMPLADLISEGNMGLMKAVERFDETRGFKFISYAVWWIRQAILQALAEQSRIVRVPLNRVGVVYKVNRAKTQLWQEHGRDPSAEEIALHLNLALNEVEEALSMPNSHLSLDEPMSSHDDGTLLDIIEDPFASHPGEQMDIIELRAVLEKVLDTLTTREAEVIALYFGINIEKPLTLEEIGERYHLTRERIRQIKEKAMRRLQHSSRSSHLRHYLKKFRST